MLVALLAVSVHAVRGSVVEGELEGAPFQVWRPEVCEGLLWVRLPGYRPADAPRALSWQPGAEPYGRMLEEGWTLATTLYRKNGWAVKEGQEDALKLIDHLIEEYGEFRWVLVEGESMGGLIAVHLAESEAGAGRVSGVLALGAALSVAPERQASLGADADDFEFTHAPRRPVLFVSNRNELAGPLAYLAAVSAGGHHRFVAAHSLERPGHVNLSDGERVRAFTQLFNWVSGEPPARLDDGTVEPVLAVSGGELGSDRIGATVVRIDPDYGNLDLNVTFSDLRSYGLDYGSVVALEYGEHRVFARIGDRYASVQEGDWVAVVLPDGRLRVAINMRNAMRALDISEGDALTVVPTTD